MWLWNIWRQLSSDLKQIVNVVDLAHLGIEKDFPEQLSSIPQRKKRNLDPSAEETEYDKNHSKKKNNDRTCHP